MTASVRLSRVALEVIGHVFEDVGRRCVFKGPVDKEAIRGLGLRYLAARIPGREWGHCDMEWDSESAVMTIYFQVKPKRSDQ